MSLFGCRKGVPRDLPSHWNSSVVERIERDAGVDGDTARSRFAEMLVCLDLAWHAFILHTRDYESYCRNAIWMVPPVLDGGGGSG